MFACSVSLSTACTTPACLAASRRPMSTVMIRSAGELAPSAAMRSSSPLSMKIAAVVSPVSSVKASSTGWIRSGCRDV
jgi:hypothetical protein